MKTMAWLPMFAAVIAVGAAAATGTDFTFTAYYGGAWDSENNWDPQGYPHAGDTATIPETHTCVIPTGEEEACASLNVESGGTLVIAGTASLTLTEDSTVDGQIDMRVTGFCLGDVYDCDNLCADPGILHIAESLTITGSGGFIRAGCRKECLVPGRISAEEDAVLTLASGPSGVLTVKGHFDLRAELVNNSVVQVDGLSCDNPYTMTLSTEPKSGSGTWRVTTGYLVVGDDAPVTGSATWEVDGECAVLRIDEVCTPLSGNVRFIEGTIDVNRSFCSTGGFQIGPEDVDVDVASDASLGLGGACPSP